MLIDSGNLSTCLEEAEKLRKRYRDNHFEKQILMYEKFKQDYHCGEINFFAAGYLELDGESQQRKEWAWTDAIENWRFIMGLNKSHVESLKKSLLEAEHYRKIFEVQKSGDDDFLMIGRMEQIFRLCHSALEKIVATVETIREPLQQLARAATMKEILRVKRLMPHVRKAAPQELIKYHILWAQKQRRHMAEHLVQNKKAMDELLALPIRMKNEVDEKVAIARKQIVDGRDTAVHWFDEKLKAMAE